MDHVTIDVRGPVHVLDAGGPDDGDRPALVLVHGLDGSAANWWDVAPDLADDHRVIAPDLPGFGRTRLRRRWRSITAHADLVVAVAQRVVAARPERRVVLVGNSMGGPVVLAAAARHPDLVAGVVLVAPALPRAGTSRIDASWLPVVVPIRLPVLPWLEPLRRHGVEPERRVRALLDLCYAPGGARESPEAFAEMVAVAQQRRTLDHARGWAGAARSLFTWLCRRGAFHDLAARVAAPVLVLEGGADPIIPRANVTAACERHPSWQRITLPHVGHVPQLEAPDAFVTHLRDFTEQLRPAG